tara:strand:- start:8556 stop:8774 length:219 start_codon:yes stop_codon:yes gene_type:complete
MKSNTAFKMGMLPIALMFAIAIVMLVKNASKEVGWFFTICSVLVIMWMVGWLYYSKHLKQEELDENSEWDLE